MGVGVCFGLGLIKWMGSYLQMSMVCGEASRWRVEVGEGYSHGLRGGWLTSQMTVLTP